MKSRIEELEEALRESVKITAQREMHMAQQQMRLEAAEMQVSCHHTAAINKPSTAVNYYYFTITHELLGVY